MDSQIKSQLEIIKSGKYYYCVKCHYICDLNQKKISYCMNDIDMNKIRDCQECEKAWNEMVMEDQQRIKEEDQPDMKWNIGLGIQANIRAGSSKVNSEDGAVDLRTTEVLRRTETVYPIKSTTPLSMRKYGDSLNLYPRVHFMGWAFPFDQAEGKYKCEVCFEKMFGKEVSYEVMHQFCIMGDISMEEFHNRLDSFEEKKNRCVDCNDVLCTIQEEKDDIIQFK